LTPSGSRSPRAVGLDERTTTRLVDRGPPTLASGRIPQSLG
jgi:hypothetical protein